MYKIAICDDEATSLTLNRALSERILDEEEIEYEITSYHNIEDAMNDITNGHDSFDLLLMDILMSGKNGIQAAQEIRALEKQMDIIFISATDEYALEGYRVNALRYIKKPITVDSLREGLLTAYKRIKRGNSLNLHIADKAYRIMYTDILYLECDGRDVNIHISSGKTLIIRMKFQDIEKMLPKPEFLRCHRSYIVRLSSVIKVERYQATMTNQEKVPISQNLFSDTRNYFLHSHV